MNLTIRIKAGEGTIGFGDLKIPSFESSEGGWMNKQELNLR